MDQPSDLDVKGFVCGYIEAIKDTPRTATGERWGDEFGGDLTPFRSGEQAAVEADCAELIRQHRALFERCLAHPELTHWNSEALGYAVWWKRQGLPVADPYDLTFDELEDEALYAEVATALKAYGPHRNGPYEEAGTLSYGRPNFQHEAQMRAALAATQRWRSRRP